MGRIKRVNVYNYFLQERYALVGEEFYEAFVKIMSSDWLTEDYWDVYQEESEIEYIFLAG